MRSFYHHLGMTTTTWNFCVWRVHSSLFFLSRAILCCANKLTLGILQKEEEERAGTYCAKLGVMEVNLPASNFIRLIVLVLNVGQDLKTFWSEIAAFMLPLKQCFPVLE